MRHLTSLVLLAALSSTLLGGSALAKQNTLNLKPNKFVEARPIELNLEAEVETIGGPEADLYIKELVYDGSTMTLSYKVGNQGLLDIDPTLSGQNEVYLDGELLITRPWSNHPYSAAIYLAAGGEFTTPLLMYAFPEWDQGPHTVKVCVNVTHVVSENDLNNNCITKTIIKQGNAHPDLVVENAYVHLETDGTATLHYTLQNESKVSVTPLYNGYTTVTVNGEVLTEDLWEEDEEWESWLGSESDGVHRSLSLGTVEADQNYTAEVCVDSQDGVVESDEDNNCTEINYTSEAVTDPDEDSDEDEDTEDEEDKPKLTLEDLIDFLEQYDEDSWIKVLITVVVHK